MKRRAFLQLLGLSPAATLIPEQTQAKLIEAAEEVIDASEGLEIDDCMLRGGDMISVCWSLTDDPFPRQHFIRPARGSKQG